jgi:hypothetical protein
MNDLPLVRFSSLAGFDGLVHAVSTRQGGVSSGYLASLNLGKAVGDDPQNVEANHRLLAEALGLHREHFTTTWQVHGRHVLHATREARGSLLGQADGIITDEPGVPLTQRYADCTPILVYDPVRHAVGLAHAGWRGTVAGMAGALVEAMVTHYGSDPASMAAVIGPSIGPCCYEVGDEVIAAARLAFADPSRVLGTPVPVEQAAHQDSRARKGTHQANGQASRLHFNLWDVNRLQLAEAGVRQIEVSGLCTSCRRDLFFSHRGDRGRTGRFGAVVMLKE